MLRRICDQYRWHAPCSITCEEAAMSLRFIFVVTLVLSSIGCFSDWNHNPNNTGFSPSVGGGSALWTPPDPPPSLDECSPSDDAWNDITRLYVDTEWSIHELITCGQVQVRLAQSMLAIVLASNEDLFRGDTFERVAQYAASFGLDLESPFEQAENGRWSMPIDGADPTSRFWVQFFRPGSEEPILDDPFRLDSYLQGVHVETELTLDEMLDDIERRNTFWFFWQEEGPLIDLLNDGEPLARIFKVEVSIADIAALVYPFFDNSGAEYGPLVSLVDAEMISCVELRDTRDRTVVEYRADGRRDTIAAIAGDGKVAFDVDAIDATDGTYTMHGDATDLRFLDVKSLAGEIFYEITGPDLSIEVVSDFGSGNPWPVTRWACGDCEGPHEAPE